MSKYGVTFTQTYYYEVEARDENEAENTAYEKFSHDTRSPIANTGYDDVEVEELEDEDGEEY